MRRAAIGVLALAAAGCAEPPGEPSLVDRLRILAVVAEPPEVAPGESVALDALVVAPPGVAAPELTWSLCAEPVSLQPLAAGECATASAGALVALPGPTIAPPLELAPLLASDETVLPLRVRLHVVSGAESDDWIAQVAVSTRAAPNRNPEILELAVEQDGGAFLLTATTTEPETFEKILADGERVPETELLSVHWLTTLGRFEHEETAPGEADRLLDSDGAATVYAVVWDSRGGYDYASLELAPAASAP